MCPLRRDKAVNGHEWREYLSTRPPAHNLPLQGYVRDYFFLAAGKMIFFVLTTVNGVIYM